MTSGILFFCVLWAIFMGIFFNWEKATAINTKRTGKILAFATLSALATTGVLMLIVYLF